ncbi:Phage repressor protein C, contains Cro/C1-type HTH and peptisase s24 domains [Cyclobacterium lianum]|uniref:Phage repressor protein C, contains Cro/C1-type HTH and peptisase s24 domains n=1 Tax=Cyclobacterium lianum TaxID=388280 RepID=A0A1M7P825_9BACT|nr:LexA family transcriptional regulator [Cyclobacterium lianum]SHN12346.1 Phage repressor protein C, contains Cro/C1-type HTH and peptisase s24 domains [Cyclobacterium lianum]
MKFLSENIKFLRKTSGLTQTELADKLGVQRSMISAYEDGRSDPKISALETLTKLFDLSMDELVFWDIRTKGRRYLQKDPLKILTIALDAEDEERISMVGHKASAGYLNGYADPEYMEKLPNFSLPNLATNRTYRAFEISGDSMLPLMPGTLIIGAYVESALEVKNGKTYVLVTKTEGIVYKRVFNYIQEKGKLFAVSDNDRYKPFDIAIQDVLEIWEAKAYVSKEFPEPSSSGPVTLEDLAAMIQEIKADIRRTNDR